MTVNDDDRQFVAEYVLGTLPAALRLMTRTRISDEPDIADVARMWERRLAPLHELAVPIAPPADLWADIAVSLIPPPIPLTPEEEEEIKKGLPALQDAFAVPNKAEAGDNEPVLAEPLGDMAPGVQARLKKWRWTAILLGVALVGGGSVFAYREWDRYTDLHYFASLQAERSAAVLVRVGVRDGDILVRPFLDPAPAGQTYQLWLVPDGQPARSLGTFSSGFTARSDILRRLGPKGAAKAMLQVTLEPGSGSDVVPTGEVLYSGRLLPE
ncbi:hypothetical protein GCM10007301_48830 [Azorhizobium oxalatiphilum]|uniref:Anti-sigma K factor RskA C-terminal domain-containing protein n=1 Tax=Azorhizobium oxalatiphilum TaxID=980631 RepID=A0A917CDD3_9HYPH|nr:anti-sigma factor [Azorhizobium oxalatiphilum]GGF82928.1 hypothetical protein GCM10007301_48830 [Azorhizobium oxalatiphilum]